MLDNDPRYLRPESRVEMDKRISSLSVSPSRRRRNRKTQPPPYDDALVEVKEEPVSDSSPYEELDPVEQLDCVEVKKEALAGSPELSELNLAPPSINPAMSSQYSLPVSDTQCMAPPSVTATANSGQTKMTSKAPRRQSTVFSTSTEMSSPSVRDLQKRVSDCSTRYAKQISTILKRFTISSATDLTQPSPAILDRRPSMSDMDQPQASEPEPQEPDIFEAFPEPCFALPGDFINPQRLNCAGFPGQDHYSGKCWCSIAEALSEEKGVWLFPNGELSPGAQQVLEDPSQMNLATRDCFGNTPLHLFAALEGYQEPLFGMILHSANPGATNSAGQTFLHVLNLEWFADLKSLSSPLKQLLAYLRDSSPDLVYTMDVYGRTFFHRAHSVIRDSEILDGILSPFNPALSSRRDAFGFNPLANTNLGGEGPFIPPRRGPLTPLPEEVPSSGTRRNSPQTSNDEEAFLAYHARLIQIVQSSFDNPRIEDGEGRNGLHCLAEAIINPQMMDDWRTSMNTRRPLKRKYDKKDNPDDNNEGPLAPRRLSLENLLRSRQPVDVNHYDKLGNTVLMAFITFISDDMDDKAKTLSSIIETLIRAGARIEARNRRGETALLIAARLGRKIALATLLEHGANVHVRDVDGKGILQIIDSTCGLAKGELALYARLEACRVLLTGRRGWGVVHHPTVVQEWRIKAAA